MIPGTTDYFSQGMEMSEGITSARSLTSMSKMKGSFYSNRNAVDRRQNSEESTDVDSDPDVSLLKEKRNFNAHFFRHSFPDLIFNGSRKINCINRILF